MNVVITLLVIVASKLCVQQLIRINLSNDFFVSGSLVLNIFLFKSLGLTLLFLCCVIISAISILFFFRVQDQYSNVEKILLIGMMTVVLINTIFKGYNFYFDRLFLIDRLVVLSVFILIFLRKSWSPLVLIFFFLSMVFVKQFQNPDIFHDKFTFTDKAVFYEVLALFGLIQFARCFIRIPSEFFFIGCWTLISIWYLMAGLGKLEIGWHNNVVTNLLLGAIPYEWTIARSQWVASIFPFLKNFNLVMIIFTLAFEVGVVLFFLHRKSALVILASLFLVHLFIFLFSGILFWKWMVFVGLLFFLIQFRRISSSLFSVRNLLIHCLYCLIIFLVFDLVKLGWLDSGFVNLHRFALKDGEGNVVTLGSSFFAPYDVVFAQNRFSYLEDRPLLVDTYGAIFSKSNFDILQSAKSVNDIRKLIELKGVNSYSLEKEKEFMRFVMTYIINKRIRKYKQPFHSPYHIYQGEDQSNYWPEKGELTLQVQFSEIWLRTPVDVDTISSSVREIPIIVDDNID